jgi:hypothetical protein
MFSVLLRYDTILFYIENEIENNTLSVVFTQGTGNAVLFCISNKNTTLSKQLQNLIRNRFKTNTHNKHDMTSLS